MVNVSVGVIIISNNIRIPIKLPKRIYEIIFFAHNMYYSELIFDLLWIKY